MPNVKKVSEYAVMGRDRSKKILAEALKFYENECSDSSLYYALAGMEKDSKFRNKLENISKMEGEHASFWKSFLKRRGVTPKIKNRKVFTSIVKLLRILFGRVLIASLFELGESTAVLSYMAFLESESLSEEERDQLKKIIMDELEHEEIFSRSKQLFHVENLRDFILGMNDGLVEILGVVTGLSAVYTNKPFMVAISGLIVGVAGALSMGIGSFISVRSQREANEGIKRRMELLFRVSEDRAKMDLSHKLVLSGMPKDIAEDVAEKIGGSRKAITSLLIEETHEEELRSALYTGLAYMIGVFFPVVPYFFSSSSIMALPFSIALAGTVLALVAILISIVSGIPIKKKIVEMVSMGLGAAGLSYIFGYIIQSFFGLAT